MPRVSHINLLHLHLKSISVTFVCIPRIFADRFKAKMAIIHVTSDQTDSEQSQLVNMETSSSAYEHLRDERRYSINSGDQRIMSVNPSGRGETEYEAAATEVEMWPEVLYPVRA